jgi:hypothetical protein
VELSFKSLHNLVRIASLSEEEFDDHSLIVLHWNINLNVFLMYHRLKTHFRESNERVNFDLATDSGAPYPCGSGSAFVQLSLPQRLIDHTIRVFSDIK